MIDLDTVISEFEQQASDLARRWAQDRAQHPERAACYLFGRNEQSLTLAQMIDVVGFIDDFTDETVWMDRPVFALEQVPHHAYIVNCVLNARPMTALKRLLQAGYGKVLNYADLCRVCADVPLPDFVRQTRADMRHNAGRWSTLEARLADETSRRTLNDVLRYRLTGDPHDLAAYSFRIDEQYFEAFMAYREEVFVDAGGFQGETSEQFCLRYPDYKKVHFFEPSPQTMSTARQRLQHFDAINYIEKGLSNRAAQLLFDTSNGSANALSEQGDTAIWVDALDHCIAEPVTVVKMDIEGAELDALEGARRHIVEDHPKLAIAVYHRPSDFWQIAERVLSMREDYQIFLRHYTESWIETVMYFLPVAERGTSR